MRLVSFTETNRRLPEVPSTADVACNGLNMTARQMALQEKIEELTLYTLAQEAVIADLRSTLADERARTEATLTALKAEQAALHDRLNRLDAR